MENIVRLKQILLHFYFYSILKKKIKFYIGDALIRYVLSSPTIRLRSYEIGPAKKTLKMRRCNN